MDSALFDQLQSTLQTQGPTAAIEQLCAHLREARDYTGLFYALIMKKRHELGVFPLPTGPVQDLPSTVHAEYEEGIRSAARQIGELYLRQGQLPQAWAYYRMIEEFEPVRSALETYQPGPEEDVQPLVQMAFYEGAHPRKGFDWILERFGLCNAITTLGGGELPYPDEVKRYCIQGLVRSLYAELRGRLTAEIEAREGQLPRIGPLGADVSKFVSETPAASGAGADAPPDTPGVVEQLIANRAELFEEDCYHVDTSHLSSVVQMSIHLLPCLELGLARELCSYGQRLTGRFIGQGEPPFEEQYVAYGLYLDTLAGKNVEEGIAYFRAQAEKADPNEVGTYPAEVLVNLLLRLDRPAEALSVARKYLARIDGQRLTCPGVPELCQKIKDYRTLAEVAREQGDPVQFMAGLLAAR
jgi:hypothetical protein